MTQIEYINRIRSLYMNVSQRNCNLISLGYVIDNTSLIQLQFLSLLEACFKRIEIFDEHQVVKLINNLNCIADMAMVDTSIYDTITGVDQVTGNVAILLADASEEQILKQICLLYASYGGDSINECCKTGYYDTPVYLYNMFISAICAKSIGRTTVYNQIINYIIDKLKMLEAKYSIGTHESIESDDVFITL